MTDALTPRPEHRFTFGLWTEPRPDLHDVERIRTAYRAQVAATDPTHRPRRSP